MKVLSSWSGGKDSCLALYRAMQSGLNVSHLVNMAVDGRAHGLDGRLIRAQSEAMGLPLTQKNVTWDTYEAGFKETVSELKEVGFEGMVFGDIDLQEHRDWVENTCAELGIKSYLPLWDGERKTLIREFLDAGFEAVLVCTRSDVLGKDLLGRVLDEELVGELGSRGVDLCGEAGEYHTLVTDGPIFTKRISLGKSRLIERDGKWILDVTDFELK